MQVIDWKTAWEDFDIHAYPHVVIDSAFGPKSKPAKKTRQKAHWETLKPKRKRDD